MKILFFMTKLLMNCYDSKRLNYVFYCKRVYLVPIFVPFIMDFSEMDLSKGGYLLFDKPYGFTSFDAVGRVRWALRKKYWHKFKVGHAGTLDPLATGLLIICWGFYTKKIDEFQNLEKEYEGVL